MVGKVTVRGDCLREGRASIHLHTQGVTVSCCRPRLQVFPMPLLDLRPLFSLCRSS